MDEDRREADRQMADPERVKRVAADLGLDGEGPRFFCPGCQPTRRGAPELVIKGGRFQCFRCGTEGDLVGLVKLARGCDLQEAILWLAGERKRIPL